ncbi:hypothetical [Yersinia pestis KIM10+]|uniref:Uncharacterized protein n=1 Tax=Yersinia pestis TaxID=632 RepID=Q8CKR2_YERPE|nr:hypothetical [Yersinia pestis KIM10+]
MPDSGNNISEVAPHRRLAPRQADFFRSQQGKGAADAIDFVKAQKTFDTIWAVALWQAICATEIAHISDR